MDTKRKTALQTLKQLKVKRCIKVAGRLPYGMMRSHTNLTKPAVLSMIRLSMNKQFL
jgi:hypothetical protein